MATLQIERGDGYVVVRLDRPPANAINNAMRREIKTTFDALGQDKGINAVVLSSTNDRLFCAGRDLREPNLVEDDVVDVRSLLDPLWEWRVAQTAVHECLVPVIAAVEGTAVGGGFGLVGVCDLVVASHTARFGLTEINVGMLGGASKALRLLGPSKARRMLFLGELIDADEFHRLGGIEEVVEPGSAERRAIEFAAELAKKSPVAIRLAKESVLRLEAAQLMSWYRTENDYSYRMRTHPDSREALDAFLQRREPRWQW